MRDAEPGPRAAAAACPRARPWPGAHHGSDALAAGALDAVVAVLAVRPPSPQPPIGRPEPGAVTDPAELAQCRGHAVGLSTRRTLARAWSLRPAAVAPAVAVLGLPLPGSHALLQARGRSWASLGSTCSARPVPPPTPPRAVPRFPRIAGRAARYALLPASSAPLPWVALRFAAWRPAAGGAHSSAADFSHLPVAFFPAALPALRGFPPRLAALPVGSLGGGPATPGLSLRTPRGVGDAVTASSARLGGWSPARPGPARGRGCPGFLAPPARAAGGLPLR